MIIAISVREIVQRTFASSFEEILIDLIINGRRIVLMTIDEEFDESVVVIIFIDHRARGADHAGR